MDDFWRLESTLRLLNCKELSPRELALGFERLVDGTFEAAGVLQHAQRYQVREYLLNKELGFLTLVVVDLLLLVVVVSG